MASEQLYYTHSAFFPRSVHYAKMLNQQDLIWSTRINNVNLHFINPKNDTRQGFYLLQIAYAAVKQPWDVDALIRHVNKSAQCQLTEQKLVTFLRNNNVFLNVMCISQINHTMKTDTLYETDVSVPWIIFYKSGVQWKLAVHIENDRNFYPLFTTAFIRKLKSDPIEKNIKTTLDDTCIPLTEARRKSNMSSERRRDLAQLEKHLEEESKARRAKTVRDDEAFAKKIQAAYLESEFGGSQKRLDIAKDKFSIKASVRQQLSSLKKIRAAPRRVSHQLNTLRRNQSRHDSDDYNVFRIVEKELRHIPKVRNKVPSKSRRQSNVPLVSDVLNDDAMYAQQLDEYYQSNPGRAGSTPTRRELPSYKKK